MDKNMINIDDLFKQRLAGGEEKEPAGAWLRMQDLLDKNVPDKVAVGYNWRRMFGYLTGLVLLSVASVGGYRMYTAHQKTDPTAVASTAKMSGVLGSSHMSTLNNAQQSHDVVTANQVTANNGSNINSGSDDLNNNNLNNNNSSGHSHKLLASTAKTYKKHDASGVNADNNITVQQSVKANSNDEAAHEKLVAGNYGFSKADKAESGEINTTAKKNNKTSKSAAINTKLAKNSINKAGYEQAKKDESNVTGERTVSKQAGSSASVAENNIVPASGATSASNAPAAKVESKPIAKNNVSASGANIKKARITKDSINMITTKQTYARRGVIKVDTVEKGKIAHDVVVADETNKQQAANDIIPAASANIKSGKDNGINLASNAKVAARKGSGYSESRFEQMVKNAKPDFSRISFYPSIIGGINTSIGKNNPISGFQLGVVGNLNLTEHWSVFAELKYMQNFNMNGSVIRDNYNNNLQDSIFGGQKKYSWDSVEHSWSYTSLSSIHLPVAVKYTMKQLSIFCGADFAYNFGIANSYDNTVVHHISEITNANQGSSFDPDKTTSKVSYNDLSARFGVGAVLGVGYHLTPAMQIDLRMVENLWDNTKTNGAYMVSDQIYNRPSLQLNVSYRFSKNKYRQPAP